jgi:hypothetical protein
MMREKILDNHNELMKKKCRRVCIMEIVTKILNELSCGKINVKRQ